MVIANNLEGHRARFDTLLASKPYEEALQLYVGGGGDIVSIGHREVEAIALHHTLDGAYVIDIGCGIGRMTSSIKQHSIAKYLGTEIISEAMEHAQSSINDDPRFSFKLADNFQIPEKDAQADIVCAFSVLTHLLDEEAFSYFSEAARVLKQGGVAIFSFLDYQHPEHRDMFLSFANNHNDRHDVLKWFEKSTLELFAKSNGLRLLEFQDSGSPKAAQFAGQSLSDGRKTGETFSIGQSLVYLAKD